MELLIKEMKPLPGMLTEMENSTITTQDMLPDQTEKPEDSTQHEHVLPAELAELNHLHQPLFTRKPIGYCL